MARTFVILCAVFFLASALVQADPKRFDNYRIFRVAIDSLKQLDALRDNSFYFIDEPSNVGQEVQVIIAPHQQSLFDGLIKRVALKSQLLVSNVQSLIDQEQRQELFRGSRYNVEAYHRVDEMYAWLDSLAVTYPKIVTRIKGGDTYQNRSIEGVKLSKNPNNPAIFIESNIHAREWLTSASTNWIINELLTSSDPEIQALLNNYNWYIFPVVNPDGYEYSHTDNRLWRKTRSPNGDDSECVGTDANRNFDSHWGGRGSSKDPCDNTYAGSSVFSEVEMRTLSQYAMSLKDEVKVYLAFHSAARMILSPWGHTSALPDNHDDLLAIMTTAYARLNAVHGTHYIFGNSCKTIYPTTGTASDWAYGKMGVKVAFTYEFRDRSDMEYYGFVAPPSEIKPNAEEVLQSLIGLTKKANELGYFK